MTIPIDELLAWLGWATTAILGAATVYNRYRASTIQAKVSESEMKNDERQVSGAPKGKGGNFDSRPNPFAGKATRGKAPRLSDALHVAGVLDEVMDTGCAVMLGHTRDGGALCITVLDGDTRHRTYCSDDGELADAVNSLHETFTVD